MRFLFRLMTALHYSSFTEYLDISELLIASGADVNAKDDKCGAPTFIFETNSFQDSGSVFNIVILGSFQRTHSIACVLQS